MTNLWSKRSESQWLEVLGQYEKVIASQTSSRLAELDEWYRESLPNDIKKRAEPHLTLDDLARLTEWKMVRGVWRARNLALVRSNSLQDVVTRSTEAFAHVPHPTSAISTLASLKGVGPATASAAIAAFAPAQYPFFDELVAAQVPDLGEVRWTLGYYARYAKALQEKAAGIGGEWTPVMVERALWANSGGKIGQPEN